MQKTGCTRLAGVHLLEGAGHWVQQEQPEQVSKLLVQFLLDNSPPENKS
jgi:pimeloyl-ACP methyl ester carboxylesterase